LKEIEPKRGQLLFAACSTGVRLLIYAVAVNKNPLRFDPHSHRTWQPGIKLAYSLALMHEDLFFHFTRFHVQNRQRLLSGM
jgi:hypothetical protein